MELKEYKVIELRLGCWDLQRERLFLVESTITAEEVRKKYNKCIDALKKAKLDKPFHDEEDFVLRYLEEEYGWKRVISDIVIHDKKERYEKIQDKEYQKVYLEEK
jgi:hypothetical protein